MYSLPPCHTTQTSPANISSIQSRQSQIRRPVLGQLLAGVAWEGLGTKNILPGGRLKTREIKLTRVCFMIHKALLQG